MKFLVMRAWLVEQNHGVNNAADAQRAIQSRLGEVEAEDVAYAGHEAEDLGYEVRTFHTDDR